MSAPLQIRRYEMFQWETKDYLCLLTEDNVWWVYLPSIFGTRLPTVRKKYSTFSFRSKSYFEKFSFPKFSTRSREGVFLSFQEFRQLLQNEKKESLLLIFEEKLRISSANQNGALLETCYYIYITIFPSLKLGKIGITENWKKRLAELQRDYHKDGEMHFYAETKNPRKLETYMLQWLKNQGALVSFKTKRGSDTREIFSLTKISETKVCHELMTQLSLEKEAKLFRLEMTQKLEMFLLEKLQRDEKFAVSYYIERERMFYNESLRLLSEEKREQIVMRKLAPLLGLFSETNDEKVN